MSGLTSGLHIKNATTKRVQQAVTELLSSEGFQVSLAQATDGEAPDQRITRGLWIAKGKGDWVSLFCSDFLFQQEIGRELSRRLGTHTLNVWINDASSWHYTLFDKGEEIDQFDSGGDEELLDEYFAEDEDGIDDDVADDLDDDLPAADEDDEDDSPLQEGLNEITQLHEKLSHKMPEDVRLIVDRLNEGRASLGEMRRFDEWSQEHQAELLSFQNQLQEKTAELSASIQGMFEDEFEGEEESARDVLKQVLPPDMADAFGKILAGEASYEDLTRLAELAGLDKLRDDDPLLAGAEDDDEDSLLTPSLEDEDEDLDDEEYFDDEELDDEELNEEDERAAFTEEQLQIHLGALRPLLDKDVDPDVVTEALTTQDEMPEQMLGELFELIGIDDSLSELDFDAIDEIGGEELAERGIELGELLLVRTK